MRPSRQLDAAGRERAADPPRRRGAVGAGPRVRKNMPGVGRFFPPLLLGPETASGD